MPSRCGERCGAEMPDLSKLRDGISRFLFLLRFRIAYFRRRVAIIITIDRVNASGTVLIGLATIAVFVSTTLQWVELSRSDERSRRAWISPVSIEILQVWGADDNQDYVQFVVNFENTGREPALYTALYASPQFFDAGSVKRLGYSLSDLETSDITFLEENKSCDQLQPLTVSGTAYPSTITKYQTGSLLHPWKTIYDFTQYLSDNKLIFYINGCFSYSTVGTTRYSMFCQYLRVEGGHLTQNPFKFCPSGNWAN
jgi:hypothetical protein